MKRLISFILMLAMVISIIPSSAFAANESCYAPYSANATLIEVARDNAPIRTGAGEENSIVVRCAAGTVLEVVDSKINIHLNKWYKVVYRNTNSNVCYSGYIYSNNTRAHNCNYESMSHDGVIYKYCDCGRIVVTVKTGSAKTLSMQSVAAAAAGLSVLDGPVPAGDAIGLGVLVGASLMMATGAIPTTSAIVDVLEDIDFDEYLRKKDQCPRDSYRKVLRVNDLLKYVDNSCLNAIQAYIYVLCGGDVHCQTWDIAYVAASMHHDGCYFEVDADQPGYYYHFHLGQKDANGKVTNKVGGHIFYGKSADGTMSPV